MRTGLAAAVVCTLAVSGLAGCQTTRHVEIDPRVATYQYQGTVAQLAERTRLFLADQGYRLREQRCGAERCVLHTQWRPIVAAKRAGQHFRYIAVIQRGNPGRAVIQLARVSRTTNGMAGFHPQVSTRDSKETPDWGGEGADGLGSGEPLRTNPDIVTRDLELEWALMRTLAPAAAHALAVSRPVRPQPIASTASRLSSSARGSR